MKWSLEMVFSNEKKRAKLILKENSKVFADKRNILFGPRYDEFVDKSITWKKKSKKLVGGMK